MTLKKIVTGDRGRIAQLVPGAGNNQQVRASDLNTVIDQVNENTDAIASIGGEIDVPQAAIPDITDSSGGTAGSAPFTIAAITNVQNVGSADITPTADAIAKLVAQVNLITAALQSAGIIS